MSDSDKYVETGFWTLVGIASIGIIVKITRIHWGMVSEWLKISGLILLAVIGVLVLSWIVGYILHEMPDQIAKWIDR